MATIFHLALASDWAEAQRTGEYTTSTRGRTLAEEGFIHASRADQWTGVRERYYADVTEPLLLLQIDTDLLDVPVLEEPAASGTGTGTGETFPHIYGRLPVAAVVKAIPVPAAEPAPPVTAESSLAPPAAPPRESFSRIYLREMFFNVAMVCIVLALGSLGILAGQQAGGDWAPVVLGLAGVAIGGVVAVAVYRRHHARSAPA